MMGHDFGDRLANCVRKRNSPRATSKADGPARPYISRVENNHTGSDYRNAGEDGTALEVPMYQLFYDGEERPNLRILPSDTLLTKLLGVAQAKMRDF